MTKKFTGKGLWLLSVFALALAMLPLTGGKAWASVGDTINDDNGIVYEVTKDDEEAQEVKVTGWGTFGGQELTIPQTVTKDGTEYNVTEIGDKAFEDNTSLTSITLPEGLTKIGNSAFLFCLNLQTVNLPNSLETIGSNAFQTSGLSSIVWPANVKTIGDSAFLECSSLSSITLPDGLQSIDNKAFWGCFSLTEITLPEELQTIGDNAFWYCTSLTEITLPEGLKTIGGKAFEDCENLRVNITGNTLPGIGIGAFDDVKQVTCRNPKVLEQLEDYLGADTGKGFMVYDLSKITPAINPDRIIYTGQNEIKPEITLPPQDETTFTVGEDYTLKYKDNTASGQGTVTITPTDTGKLYGDPVSKQFAIYQVTFNAGEGGNGNMTLSEDDVEGLKIKLPKTCEFTAPNGMVFKAWQVGDTEYGLGDDIEIGGDTTITALWENEYTISFNAGGGSGTIADVKVTESNNEFSLPKTCVFTPPNDNMEFKAWLVGDTEYGLGAKITVTEDTIVTALWQDKPEDKPTPGDDDEEEPGDDKDPGTSDDDEEPGNGDEKPGTSDDEKEFWTIEIELNGGALPDLEGTTLKVPKDTDYTLPTPQKTGYTLEHWQIGQGGNTAAAGDVYRFSADTKIYAIWQENQNGSKPGGGGGHSRPTTPSQTTPEPTKPETSKPDTSKPGSTQPAKTAADVFPDLVPGGWYMEAVNYVYGQGLMQGNPEGGFAPNANLTRAELAQILYNKEGKPRADGPSAFGDVAGGQWYTAAINWAAAKGIVLGYENNLFAPNDHITREQLAVMLWRYNGSPAVTRTQLPFKDAQEISSYALDAVCWAVEKGILKGYGDDLLKPGGFATRGEVAQMLFNLR